MIIREILKQTKSIIKYNKVLVVLSISCLHVSIFLLENILGIVISSIITILLLYILMCDIKLKNEIKEYLKGEIKNEQL